MDSPKYTEDPDFIPEYIPEFSDDNDVDEDVNLEDQNVATIEEKEPDVAAVPETQDNPPEEIDLLIYDPSIDKDLYMDMKKNRPPNWEDPAWKYGAWVGKKEGRTTQPIKCLLCGLITTGGINRLKVHLAHINPQSSRLNVKVCPKVPMKIREEMGKLLLAKTSCKKPPLVDIELLPSDPIKRKMELSGASTRGSSTASKKITQFGKMKVVGPLGLAKDENLHDIIRKRKTEIKRQTTMVDHIKKQEKELFHQYAGRFFFTSGVPFNVALNPELWVIHYFFAI